MFLLQVAGCAVESLSEKPAIAGLSNLVDSGTGKFNDLSLALGLCWPAAISGPGGLAFVKLVVTTGISGSFSSAGVAGPDERWEICLGTWSPGLCVASLLIGEKESVK